MNKEEMLKAVDELENEYDAYYMMNKYGDKNTHAKHTFMVFLINLFLSSCSLPPPET